MHAPVGRFTRVLPSWLLLESDGSCTGQAAPFMPCCSDIVSIGRLRWIEGTTMTGKQDRAANLFVWYQGE